MKIKWPFVSRKRYEEMAKMCLMNLEQGNESAASLMNACERIMELEEEAAAKTAALRQCRARLKAAKGKA